MKNTNKISSILVLIIIGISILSLSAYCADDMTILRTREVNSYSNQEDVYVGSLYTDAVTINTNDEELKMELEQFSMEGKRIAAKKFHLCG